MMRETVPANRRVYAVITRPTAGVAELRLTPTPPALDDVLGVFLWRGMLPLADDIVLDLVTEPAALPPGPAGTIAIGKVTTGAPGSAVTIVNRGTASAALLDITLPAGAAGADATAQQIAAAATAWLTAHPPAPGADASDAQVASAVSTYLSAHPPVPGSTGLSAYQVATVAGFSGTAAQWLASLVGKDGTSPALGIGTVTTLAAGSAAMASLSGTAAAPKLNLGIPQGAAASTVLGTITVAQMATLQISVLAGTRRVTVTIPASWGVVAGDSLLFAPTQALAGYATHDVVAVSPTSVSIGVTGPQLAVGTGYSIAGVLRRLT